MGSRALSWCRRLRPITMSKIIQALVMKCRPNRRRNGCEITSTSPPAKSERQQQQGLFHRLTAVQPIRAHQVLQSRPVSLPAAPGEPPDRLTPSHRHRPKVPHGRSDLVARVPPGCRPAPCPVRAYVQHAADVGEAGVGLDQLVPAAAVRPSRTSARHDSSVTTVSCSHSHRARGLRIGSHVPRVFTQ